MGTALAATPCAAEKLSRPKAATLSALATTGGSRYSGEFRWDLVSNNRASGELRLAFMLLPNGMYQVTGALTEHSHATTAKSVTNADQGKLVGVFAGAALWESDSTLRISLYTMEGKRGFTPPETVRMAMDNPHRKLDIAATVALTATLDGASLNGTHQVVFATANAQGELTANSVRYEEGTLTLKVP